jgi:hypothetical protein
MVSFSGDDSGFESENDALQSEGDRTPTARRRLDEDEDQSEDEEMDANNDDDDGVEIFDHMLEILERRDECTLYECDDSSC